MLRDYLQSGIDQETRVQSKKEPSFTGFEAERSTMTSIIQSSNIF